MRKPTLTTLLSLIFAFSLVSSIPSSAHPTGAALVTCPVEPCRFLDTRTSLGPLAGGTAMDVYIRGSALDASDGAQRTDCGVPPWAESVMVNIQSLNPTSVGHLKINGTGRVAGVMGTYSRTNYRPLENDANEILVSLCNEFLYPAGPSPCGDPGPKFLDFQILNGGPAGSSLHIAAEVVAYYQRADQGACSTIEDNAVIGRYYTVHTFSNAPFAPGGAPIGRLIVTSTGTVGVFVGHEDELTWFDGEEWVFEEPKNGDLAYISATGDLWRYRALGAAGWARVVLDE